MTLQDPMRRTERLIAESAGDNVVIYDRDTDRVTALDAADSKLWEACDGTRSLADLAALTSYSETEAAAALARLAEAGLMQETGMSRRALMTKAGLVGAGVGVVSLASVMAPVAAHAASIIPPSNGAAAGVAVATPIIRLNGALADISLKNGVTVVPPVIGTGFGSTVNVAVTYKITNAKGVSTSKTVNVMTTDDGSFYVGNAKLPNVSPGSVINIVATDAGKVTAKPLTSVIGLVNKI